MSKLSLITFMVFMALTGQGFAQMDPPPFSEIQNANEETRAEFLDWVVKLSKRMKRKGSSVTFYGQYLQNTANDQCGLGFDGSPGGIGRFYVFLGDGEDIIERAVDIPFVYYQFIEITMGEGFIELRSVYSIQGDRDYRLRIDIDDSGFPIKATGKVYYKNGAPTYENTCEFPNV